MSSERNTDDVSEPASPRLIAEARERGSWPRSGELVLACVVLAAVLAARFAAGNLVQDFAEPLADELGSLGDVRTPDEIVQSCRVGLVRWVGLLGPVLAIPTAAAMLVSVSQVGLRFSPHALLPDVARFDAVQRLGAIFSVQTVTRSMANLFKWSCLVGLAGWLLWQELRSGTAFGGEAASLALSGAGLIFRVTVKLAAACVVFGCIDYALAWRNWLQQMQQTRAEQLAELKESDGDPRLQQARRRRHSDIVSRRSSGKQLEPGDLVIVGKGRIAVAVRRVEPDSLRIVAKAVGAAADRIQQTARRAGARIVRNSDSACKLFRSRQTGDIVPDRLVRELSEMRGVDEIL